MGTLYLTTPDTIVHKVDECIQIRQQGELLLDLPLIKVEHVIAFGRVTITAAALEVMIQRKIGICYLTTSGRYIAHVDPPLTKNILLRTQQYKAAFNPQKTATLAAQFVRGKLANMRVALNRLQRERSYEDLEQAIQVIKLAEKAARKSCEVDVIRGHEGAGSAAYFKVFKHFIKTPDFTFSHRIRRPPPDPVNALLSLGYTILAHDLQASCHLVGFDPYLGFLHTQRYGRPSLALDLMEEFRSLIVDATVLRCINLKMLTAADFTEELGGTVRLTDNAFKTFLKAYEERKQTALKHPVLGVKVTYQRCFELQARLLARHLCGELDAYVPLVVQ